MNDGAVELMSFQLRKIAIPQEFQNEIIEKLRQIQLIATSKLTLEVDVMNKRMDLVNKRADMQI